MKKNVLIIAAAFILLSGVGSAFAAGNKDAAPQAQPGRGQWMNFASNDKVNLSGTLTVENKFFPELKVGSKLYYLMVPRYALYNVDAKDGMTVAVEGYVLKDAPMTDGKADAVMVTKAVIDGKEYDLGRGFDGQAGGSGPYPGMHHNMRNFNRNPGRSFTPGYPGPRGWR